MKTKVDRRGVMAAGPWIKPSGMLLHRVVLRVYNWNEDGVPTEFVVHVEGQHADGTHGGFSNGNYFPVHVYGKGATAVMSAYEAALKRFSERMLEKCLDLDFDCLFREEAVQVA